MSEQIEFRFDTQLSIVGGSLSSDTISEYITEHFEGGCLLAVGGDDLIKIHFHINEPRQVPEYGRSTGDTYGIVVENMQRQADGLQG